MKNFFLWGVSTSSYQIEGAYNEDEKGLSIWDEYSNKKGNIIDNSNGNTACNHYHKYIEDVEIMKSLGVNSYRFSISWSRILPNGIGEVNKKGIEFYNNLITQLIKNNIEPVVTLFHWDLPLELEKKGGWLNENSSKWFANYAEIVAKEFGDRVKYIITFNEPQIFIGHYAYKNGPSDKDYSRKEILQMIHNVLLSHGRAVSQIRKENSSIKIGYAPTCTPYYPIKNKKEDIELARRLNFQTEDKKEYTYTITWFSDPILFGKYPDDGLEIFKEDLPIITKQDLEIIKAPIDFYAQNIYFGTPIKCGKNGEIEYPSQDNIKRTSLNWPVSPESLYWGIKFLYERYKLPIYITENGAAFDDILTDDKKIHDIDRVVYLNNHIKELEKLIQDGVDVRGYFVWSLLDNFEWTYGYTKRFGIVYVDFETKKRTIKDSGLWYRDFINKYNLKTLE